jgi:HEAT repeat protein
MLLPPLPRNVEASFRDISSKKPDVRAAAARDIVRHALANDTLRERAIAALVGALSDESAGVRSSAAVGLGELDASEALQHLLVRVEDDDGHVRQMALVALGEIGDERALPRLRRALDDTRPEVRYQAVIAVGRLAPVAEAARALAHAVADSDESVQYIALRVAEERFVAEDDREAFQPLAAAARKELAAKAASSRVHAAAAIVLARLGDTSASAAILQIIRGALACDKEDEQEAVELAGELGLREAIPDLERRAFGSVRFIRDTCTFHAKIALARLGHERARTEIRRDLSARRTDTRAAAVVAAGRARLVDLAGEIRRLEDADVDPGLRDEALALLAAEGAQ